MNTENDDKMQPKFRGFFRKNGKISSCSNIIEKLEKHV